MNAQHSSDQRTADQRTADKIVLVGVPGVGKSTVGPLVAQELNWRFVDFDIVIEQESGLSVSQIFFQRGVDEFRRLESELTARLASVPDLVLAPGGGWILRNRMPKALLIWLQVEPATAVERMGPGVQNRPLMSGDPLRTVEMLLKERAELYAEAEMHIDTNGRSAAEVAHAVVQAYKDYGD
ncbi:MAG TPA: shikimate kinase [Longimicrobiales bacterium]|nr:shikimate kinase [Longimicrobiales bacterium]